MMPWDLIWYHGNWWQGTPSDWWEQSRVYENKSRIWTWLCTYQFNGLGRAVSGDVAPIIHASIRFESQLWWACGKGWHLSGLDSHTMKDNLSGLESDTGDSRLNLVEYHWGPDIHPKVESYEHAWTEPGLDVGSFGDLCLLNPNSDCLSYENSMTCFHTLRISLRHSSLSYLVWMIHM